MNKKLAIMALVLALITGGLFQLSYTLYDVAGNMKLLQNMGCFVEDKNFVGDRTHTQMRKDSFSTLGASIVFSVLTVGIFITGVYHEPNN